jgi:hypothetical protein
VVVGGVMRDGRKMLLFTGDCEVGREWMGGGGVFDSVSCSCGQLSDFPSEPNCWIT